MNDRSQKRRVHFPRGITDPIYTEAETGSADVAKNGKFIAISTNSLFDNTSSHFDVYTLVGKGEQEAAPDDFLLYAKAPFAWTLRELTDLTRVGVNQLFVEQSQWKVFERYRKVFLPPPKVDQSLEPKFRIQQIQDIGAHLMESCFLAEIDQRFMEKLSALAGQVVETLLEDPRCVRNIQALSDHDLYTYVHSVGVGTLSAAVALTMGETNREKLHEYALGGLLHDVGKKKVSTAVLNKAGPLTAEEWEEMKRHPEAGAEVMADQALPPNIMDMIKLHHEKIDGSGYPNGYMRQQIPEHVQIVTVADIFNALTTARCYHHKRSRFEGLMFMKHHLKGKISPEAFRCLVGCLVTDKETSELASSIVA